MKCSHVFSSFFFCFFYIVFWNLGFTLCHWSIRIITVHTSVHRMHMSSLIMLRVLLIFLRCIWILFTKYKIESVVHRCHGSRYIHVCRQSIHSDIGSQDKVLLCVQFLFILFFSSLVHWKLFHAMNLVEILCEFLWKRLSFFRPILQAQNTKRKKNHMMKSRRKSPSTHRITSHDDDKRIQPHRYSCFTVSSVVQLNQ